ncbi:MAG: HEAT repeat domain-containing protein [Planctomycetes bacterium]|jgi:HEAT repeat protein|nr:HEAT repeat domain-containing protein [Planctomycetota bacterium]
MEIEFCERCDASIPRSDVERGVARRIEGVLLCAPCRARDTRRRRAVLFVGPLAVLAAAALGAAVAVLLLGPRLVAIDGRVRGVAADAAAGRREVGSLREVMADLRRSDEDLAKGLTAVAERAGRSTGEVAVAIARIEERLGMLEREVLALKEHLREASVGPPAEPVEAPAIAPAPAVDPEPWLDLLADPDPGVRLSALVALAPVEDPRVATEAIRLLADSDAVVRGEAAKLVGDRREAAGIPGLLLLLSDGSARVRARAHRALEAISGRDLAGYDPVAPEAEREAAAAALRAALGG